MNMTVSSVFFSDLNPVEHVWDVKEQEVHSMNAYLKYLQPYQHGTAFNVQSMHIYNYIVKKKKNERFE